MLTRKLGRSNLEVSAVGLGCWALGGAYTAGGKAVGWGQVDDRESMRAIDRALELGITFFDTAACYGAGHSERVLGRGLAGKRDDVVIATKFGHRFDEKAREALGSDTSVDNLKQSCDDSLHRLRTDHIDILQFHVGGHDPAEVDDILATLENLVDAGKIRWYGWSTDNPQSVARFAQGKHCAVVQQRLNVLEGNLKTLAVAEREGLASIVRTPLAKGILLGKFSHGDKLPADDVRHRWDTESGVVAKAIDISARLLDLLKTDGRTPAQGALGWILAKSEITLPIPGFKSVKQVEDNVAAAEKGPLPPDAMAAIDRVLDEEGWERSTTFA
mgnify:CR=1 FL=1